VKFGYYVTYGKAKEDFDTLEDGKKAWARFGEVLKSVDLELVFWGVPFGVIGQGMCVMKGEVAGFEKIWNNPEIMSKFPLTDAHTTFVLVP